MEFIYWISVLDGVKTTSIIFSIILTAFVINNIIYYQMCSDEFNDDKTKKISKKNKISVIIIILIALMNIFVPSKKEMYIIYGGNEVINYIKSSDKIDKIPDKAIQALDKYLSEYVGDENEDN